MDVNNVNNVEEEQPHPRPEVPVAMDLSAVSPEAVNTPAVPMEDVKLITEPGQHQAASPEAVNTPAVPMEDVKLITEPGQHQVDEVQQVKERELHGVSLDLPIHVAHTDDLEVMGLASVLDQTQISDDESHEDIRRDLEGIELPNQHTFDIIKTVLNKRHRGEELEKIKNMISIVAKAKDEELPFPPKPDHPGVSQIPIEHQEEARMLMEGIEEGLKEIAEFWEKQEKKLSSNKRLGTDNKFLCEANAILSATRATFTRIQGELQKGKWTPRQLGSFERANKRLTKYLESMTH